MKARAQREEKKRGGGSITKMTLAKMKEWPACKMHTNHSSIDIGYKAWADYFLTTFSIPSNSLLSFKPIDHKIQPKFNWTRAAASGLSLSLITNYNRGQLKLPTL